MEWKFFSEGDGVGGEAGSCVQTMGSCRLSQWIIMLEVYMSETLARVC